MKSALSTVLCLILLVGVAFAQEMVPTINKKTIEIPTRSIPLPSSRTAPEYIFTKTPTSLLTSYYDYMIGSYNGLPLRSIPQSAGGGYFMTYHGQRTATGQRRAFFAYLDAQGNVIDNYEITSVYNREGYPTVAVDPVSGKPLYAWHANADADAELEVQFTSDAFISGIAGLFNGLQVIAQNPTTISPPQGTATTDNEFIWPTAQIGPSPFANKRRVYVVMRNAVTHSYGPSENVLIAYADFNGNDLEEGTPLVWSWTSIPEMNQWNHDTTWRRPFHAITVDNAGNVYYAGYHTATEADGTTDILEAEMDVFKCPNYGQGTWTRISAYSNLPSWNPPATPTGTTGYFVNDSNVPYTNAQLKWSISNSSHLNATVDDNGKIHVPALWALTNSDGFYYPKLQYMKEFVFNPYAPAGSQFTIKEIYPQANPANTSYTVFQPWDLQVPWGIVDGWTNTASGWVPNMADEWAFPYWDQSAHGDAMFFHYSNMKITEGNGQGMLAMVWQSSLRAKWFNADGDTNYSAWGNTPEIYISVSPNNGDMWSEPIKLNNIQTPQFAGLKPMWVYPADKVKYVGMQGNQKVGKLGLMFYNDFTWGSNAIDPPVHPTNDGGQVMFTELQIVFPTDNPVVTDPFGMPTVLSSSMSVTSGVMINGQMASAGDVVAAYVNVGGIPQLRGKETVMVNSGVSGCLIQVYTESDGENVYFKIWDLSANQVLDVIETLNSQVNGNIGSWPNNLFWLHASIATQQNISLLTGWNLISLNVHPVNMEISSIFGSIISNINQIKSPEGVFIPGNPYNTLTTFGDGKGYFVNVNNNCGLTVSGSQVNYATPIPMEAGWNLPGYTPQAAMPVASALSSISAYVIQVKGVEGIYIPGNPFSTLVTLSPGRAYHMKLSAAANLVYPASGRDSAAAQAVSSCEVWGNPVQKTDSHVILCDLSESAQAGDILAAFVDNEFRGFSQIIEANGKLGTLIQVFTEEVGEIINFRLLRKDNTIINLSPNLSSNPGATTGDYAKGEYYTLQAGETDDLELITRIVNAFPNPFNAGTSIRLNIAKNSTSLKVEVYNLKGQKVKTLFAGQMNSGTNDLYWNGLNESNQRVASGIYFCRLDSENTRQNIKLMILK